MTAANQVFFFFLFCNLFTNMDKWGRIHTVKENTEALVVATKEIGLEVNADKTKYMVMPREQTAGLTL